jgi:non-specific serine/threonine protein kinase/NIMA (never in mitosis gene a)-related kinase
VSFYNVAVQDFKNNRAGVLTVTLRAFGNAYLASHLSEGKNYVIKKVELTNKNAEQTENIFNEVKLLQAFKHANIVSYRESIIDGQELNIIMEFCAGGDLNQLIVEQKEAHGGRKLEEGQVVDWATQIALAIFYMHDKRILHRDLKTPNIFITDDRVKLGDFGISKVLDEKVDLASTSIGTPYYMSPEQYRHKPYSYKSYFPPHSATSGHSAASFMRCVIKNVPLKLFPSTDWQSRCSRPTFPLLASSTLSS